MKEKHLCLVCKKNETINAHLLPKSFVSDIFIDPKKGEKHIISDSKCKIKESSFTGVYDKNILCKECDNILGNYENEAHDLLTRLRENHKVTKDNLSHIKNKKYAFSVKNVNNFIRFACGILWKYGSISHKSNWYIDISNYKDNLEQICFYQADIPESIDVFIELDALPIFAFNHPKEVFYYRTPSIKMLGNKTPHQLAFFSVSNFIIYIKFDAPGLCDYAPRKCWMRNKKNSFFYADLRSLSVNKDLINVSNVHKEELLRINGKNYVQNNLEKILDLMIQKY